MSDDIISIEEALPLINFVPSELTIKNWLCGGYFPGAKFRNGQWTFSRKAINALNQELEAMKLNPDLSIPDLDDGSEPPLL